MSGELTACARRFRVESTLALRHETHGSRSEKQIRVLEPACLRRKYDGVPNRCAGLQQTDTAKSKVRAVVLELLVFCVGVAGMPEEVAPGTPVGFCALYQPLFRLCHAIYLIFMA